MPDFYVVKRDDREFWTGNGWSDSFEDAAFVRDTVAMELTHEFLVRQKTRAFSAVRVELKLVPLA